MIFNFGYLRTNKKRSTDSDISYHKHPIPDDTPFPEGHDGDIALAVAATGAIASPAYPVDEQEVRRMAGRDQVSGVRDTAAQSRQAGPK
jgi:hypothetical protein